MSELRVLAVGESPHVLFYAQQLHKTGKFSLTMVSKGLETTQKVRLNTQHFDPQFVYNDLSEVKKCEFDVVVISAGSLQEMSTLSAQLSGFLGKSSILLVESTGFVNLEPFVKNCLPMKIPVLSLMTPLDIRRVKKNEYVIQGASTIYIGQSSTVNTKYPQSLMTDIKALASLLKTDGVEVVVRATGLEFLVEQWRLAIPRICFDPLLILFEEGSPSALHNQILAKPLLSGLVTEMITVAKTMGCKLPQGYDNESSLLKFWIDSYKSSGDVKDSPELFYNFYHKNSLDIDLLLLQPILLADDHSIKTPYLEFMYATLCQLNKLNSEPSMFFKRYDREDSLKHKLEVEKLLNSIENQAVEYKNLVRDNEHLRSQLEEQGKSTSVIESMKAEKTQLQLAYQQKSRTLTNAEQQIQSLQVQLERLEQQAQHHQVELLKARSETKTQAQPPQSLRQAPMTQQKAAPRLSVPLPVSEPAFVQPDQPIQHPHVHQLQSSAFHSEGGTPDLRDLTDVAVFSASMESPTPPSAPQVPTSAPPSVPSTGSSSALLSEQSSESSAGISSRELELQKKEQLLASKELELNRKLSQLNLNQIANRAAGGFPQQLQPPMMPKMRPQQPPNAQGHPHQAHHHPHQHPHQQQFQPPQPRRTATMTMPPMSYAQAQQLGQTGQAQPSTDIYAGIPSDLSSQQFKPTSRKNRKSSLPLGQALGGYQPVPRSASGGPGSIPLAQHNAGAANGGFNGYPRH